MPTLESLLYQRLQQSQEVVNQLPSRFIVDGEFVVVQEDPHALRVKPFHDVSVLLGKKEKKLEKKYVVKKNTNVLVKVFAYLCLIFYPSIHTVLLTNLL